MPEMPKPEDVAAERELKDQRIPVMMSSAEVEAIDDWGFAQRIRSRSEVIRRLIQMGLAFDVGFTVGIIGIMQTTTEKLGIAALDIASRTSNFTEISGQLDDLLDTIETQIDLCRVILNNTRSNMDIAGAGDIVSALEKAVMHTTSVAEALKARRDEKERSRSK